MDQSEITAAIRRAIREPSPITISDAAIAAVTLRGVFVLGLAMKKVDPSFFNKRVCISSNTHVFPWPSDCLTILNVWDLEDNAGDITDATNASPINIQCVDHGFSTDDIIHIDSILGNTAANGTWKITEVDDDNYTLNGSVGNAAYTTGGKAYKEPINMNKIIKVGLEDSTNNNDGIWYAREKKVVIDDPDFTYDIIVDYIMSPDAITYIPSEYHDGLVSFGVQDLMIVPQPDSPEYTDKLAVLTYHKTNLKSVLGDIQITLFSSTEPVNITE